MPISALTYQSYAVEIRRAYQEAERIMLAKLAARLKAGIDTLDETHWMAQKLTEIVALRGDVTRQIVRLRKLNTEIAKQVESAYNNGAYEAVQDLRRAKMRDLVEQVAPTRAVAIQTLTAKLVGALNTTHFQILRAADDIYRSTIAEAAQQATIGTMTRRQAAQRALNAFADKGVKGFVDTTGRAWDLASYTEMATRTTTGQAAVEGHIRMLEANDKDLVIVHASADACDTCAPWNGKVLSLNGTTEGYPTLTEAMSDSHLQGPNCVIGETRVSGSSALRAFGRWYEGRVIIIQTASGKELTVTPNHPILTSSGWVAADLLRKGDNVIRYHGKQRVIERIGVDEVETPPMISQVADTFRKSADSSVSVATVSAADFHGDGEGSKVYVVWADGMLRLDDNTTISEPIHQHDFSLVSMAEGSFLASSTLAKISHSSLHASDSIMGFGGLGSPAFCSHARRGSSCGLALVDCDSGFMNPSTDASMTDSESLPDLNLGLSGLVESGDLLSTSRESAVGEVETPGLAYSSDDIRFFESLVDESHRYSFSASDLLDSLTGEITLDKIVFIDERVFTGHVYNLQTKDSWFACNSIITHNCGCSLSLYTSGMTREMEPVDPDVRAKLYQARQQQRYLERGVRKWKNREAVALDDDTQAQARANVSAYQARLRELTGETGRRRDYARESITRAR